MRAAIGCFAHSGYRRTSMDSIARAAAVSRPALYQYFRNKEEVFRAAAEWGLNRVAARAESAAAAPGSTPERLRAVLLLVLHMHRTRDGHGRPGGEFYAELVDETYARAHDVWQAFETRLLTSLAAVLARHPDELGPAEADMTAEDVALVLLYGTKGLALHVNDAALATRGLGQLVDLTVRGLAPRDA